MICFLIKNLTYIQEILKIINNKDDTTAGYDRVSVKTLKSKANNIIEPLTFIYNWSISKCTFSKKCKLEIIELLFKNRDNLWSTAK